MTENVDSRPSNESAAELTARSVMIGTAGHVDHGKTSLVRALTGFETDRHLEEKQRGVSIDISVAPCDLGDGTVVGIVDVPGHEDFIRNMVAGAASVDLLLLVVAADDGVMPQTIEHVKIAKLLGIRSVIAAVTKVDLVDPSLIPLVCEEVRALLSAEEMEPKGFVQVSSPEGRGIEELRAMLRSEVMKLVDRADNRAFRMDVRHVFSLKGFGTVLTGVPAAGRVSVGDELEILPGGTKHSVRSVQNYRSQVNHSVAHTSTALNMRDIDPQNVSRGATLIHPGSYTAATHAIVTLRSVYAKQLVRRPQLRFHVGTTAVQASLRLIDCDVLPPGAEAFAFLRLSRPVVLASGDRFILRTSSPSETVGGGTVLSVHSGRARRMTESFFERLITARKHVESGELLLAELYAGSQGTFSTASLIRRSQLPAAGALTAIAALKERKELLDLGGGGWVLAARLGEVSWSLERALTRYHHLNKLVWGMKPGYASEILELPQESIQALLGALAGQSAVTQKHGRVALESFSPQISPRMIKLREDMLALLARVGIAGIARGNLIAELSMTEPEAKQVIRLLADEGAIQSLGTHVILRSVIDHCREQLLALFRENSEVDLAQFREASGANRNVATMILESFDSEGLTRRTQAGRVLVKAAGRKGQAASAD